MPAVPLNFDTVHAVPHAVRARPHAVPAVRAVLQGEPEASELPSEWESKCNELQRLVLVRCLRPDRVVFCATT